MQQELDDLTRRVARLELRQPIQVGSLCHGCVRSYQAISQRVYLQEKAREMNPQYRLTVDVPLCVEPELTHVHWRAQGLRESRQRVISGFTPQGGVAVLVNVLYVVHKLLSDVRDEMSGCGGAIVAQSVFVSNAWMTLAATTLQNVLDQITAFCHLRAPDPQHDGLLYFSTYPFRITTYEFMQRFKNTINELTYDGMKFNDLANRCKHECPWIGLMTDKDGTAPFDIYDSAGNGVLRDMLIPVYTTVGKMLQRLGSIHQQPVAAFPLI